MAETKSIAEPGKQEIIVTRILDAPKELVYKVYTDPKHIPNWWGPGILTTTVEKMDVKAGGQWRFIQKDPEGNEYAFHGVYHDVWPIDKIISTFEYEGVPGHVLLWTVTFEGQNGKTVLTESSVFQSVEDRDGMLKAGAEGGMKESTDRLAALLATLKN